MAYSSIASIVQFRQYYLFPLSYGKKYKLHFKVIDSNYILIDSVIDIWYCVAIFFFFSNGYFSKIANSIVGYVAKQTIIDKFKIIFSDLNWPENS
jgi:hypothetical protein